MRPLLRDPLLDWLRETWRLLVLWFVVFLTWLLGGGTVFVEIIRSAAVLPDGAQDELIRLLGSVFIGVVAVRVLLRRRFHAQARGFASAPTRHVAVASTRGHHPAYGYLLATYRDHVFVAWVLARVDPAASVDDAVDYASRWHPTWQQGIAVDDSLPRRARHEAAHAIVAHELGCTVTNVTIEAHGDSGGRAAFVLPLPPPPAHDGAWIQMTALLAGQSTDHAHDVHDSGSRADIAQVLQLTATIIATGRTPTGYDGPLNSDALITAARARADQILTTRSEDLVSLTSALLEHRTMTGATVRAALGPVQTDTPRHR